MPDAAAGFPRVRATGGRTRSRSSQASASATARPSPQLPSSAPSSVQRARSKARPRSRSCTTSSGRTSCATRARRIGRRRRRQRADADDPAQEGELTFLAEIAMPFFSAEAEHDEHSKGISVYPSAGPYRIASRAIGSQVVLERNRFYKGNRPANADRIVITTNTDVNQSLLQVRAPARSTTTSTACRPRRTTTFRASSASRRAETAATSSTPASTRPTWP